MNKVTWVQRNEIKKFIRFIIKFNSLSKTKEDKKVYTFIFYLFFLCYKTKQDDIKFILMQDFYYENKTMFEKLFSMVKTIQIQQKSCFFAYYIKNYLQRFDFLIDIDQTLLELTKWEFLFLDYFFILKNFVPVLTYMPFFDFMRAFLINYLYFYSNNLKFKIKNVSQKISFKLYLSEEFTHVMQTIFKTNFNELYVLCNSLMPWKF